MTAQVKTFKRDFELYNNSATRYDEIRFSGQAGEWSHRRQIEVLSQLLPDLTGKKVLEIGAGTGRVTQFLVEAGARVTATDVSSEMLDIAKKRLGQQSPENTIQFRVLNVFDPNLSVANYDFVIALNVISRLSDPQTAILNVANGMSPGSQFVFSFNCLWSVLLPFAILVNARGVSLSRNVTSQWFTPTKIEKFCRKARLEILAWGGNHYVPNPRFLFFALPFFQVLDFMFRKKLVRWNPSVFAVTERSYFRHPNT